MKENLKFAWRNLWRNKRRTLITVASIFFGVVLSSLMSSMQEGSYAQYIKTIVNFYSGFIQIHKNGYWDDKVINNSIAYNSLLNQQVRQVPGITLTAARLETFALASSDENTKGVLVSGIDPPTEDKITTLSGKIISGSFLVSGDQGVVLGSSLAKYLKLGINDTLVLLSEGYHGASAAGKYPVRGIVKQPSPELDRTVVYMDIAQCQELLSMLDRVTSIVIMVRSNDVLMSVKKELGKMLGKNYEVMDWKEMNRILMKQIDSDRASGLIIKGVLYMVIAFGIFGTLMMMTLERRKEFGILMAIGMQKAKLSTVLVMESVLIGLVGVAAGIAVSIPLTWYFKLHPIALTGQAAETMTQMGFDPVMSFSMVPMVYYNQAITILIFTLLLSLYPVIHINKLKINKALHN